MVMSKSVCGPKICNERIQLGTITSFVSKPGDRVNKTGTGDVIGFSVFCEDAEDAQKKVMLDCLVVAESQTIEDFGAALHLMRADLEHLRSVFLAVENGDLGMLKSLGIKDSELGDVKFFLEKLVNTGFLD